MPRSSISKSLDERIRAAAKHRCGYCLSPQHLVMARLEIEHLVPRAKGGPSDESNLWLSCSLCNAAKQDRVSAIDPESANEVPLFNPRTQIWSEHFEWSPDGLRIIGRTPTGRATMTLLHLNTDPVRLIVRSYWIQAGWHPPKEI